MIGKKTYLLLLFTTLIHLKGSESCLEQCKINNYIYKISFSFVNSTMLIYNPYEKTMFVIPPDIFLFNIKEIQENTIIPTQNKTSNIETLTIFKKIRSNNNRNNLLDTPEIAHLTADFEKNN